MKMVNDSGDFIIQVRAYRSSKFGKIYNKFSTKKNHVCCLKITAWICTSCLWQTAAQHTKTNLNIDIQTLKIIHLNVITTTRPRCKMSNWGSKKDFFEIKENETGILLKLIERKVTSMTIHRKYKTCLPAVVKRCYVLTSYNYDYPSVWNIMNAWKHSQLHSLNASYFMALESVVFPWFHQPVSF